jgi:hypothetical protein
MVWNDFVSYLRTRAPAGIGIVDGTVSYLLTIEHPILPRSYLSTALVYEDDKTSEIDAT